MFALSWGADDLTQMHGRVIVDFAAEHRFMHPSPATLPSTSPQQFRSALATARKKKKAADPRARRFLESGSFVSTASLAR